MVPLIIGFSVNGWNVYRALRKEGLLPVVIDNDPQSIFWQCRAVRPIHSKELSGPELLTALERLASDGRQYLLISALEETVTFLSGHRNGLPGNIHLDFPDHHIVTMLLDKKLFYQSAIDAKCSIMPMYFFDSKWNIIGGVERLTFPYILKTRAKMYLPGLAKAYRIGDAGELRTTVERISAIPGLEPDYLLLQEWVPGGDSDVVFCMQYYDAESNPIVSFTGKKIRQWRPGTGGTASAIAIQSEAALSETTRYFQSIGMRGLCSMEFKQSPVDGKLYMIEPTACRADYQEGTAVANGYNLPYAMYCSNTQRTYRPSPSSKPVIWLHAGSDYMSYLHQSGATGLAFWNWWKSLQHKKEYAIFDWRMPGPFISLCWRRIIGKLGRLFGR